MTTEEKKKQVMIWRCVFFADYNDDYAFGWDRSIFLECADLTPDEAALLESIDDQEIYDAIGEAFTQAVKYYNDKIQELEK